MSATSDSIGPRPSSETSVTGKKCSECVVRFGAFELHSDSGELRKYGIRIRLQTKPLQVLQCLLEKPGKIVSREEIRSRLWNEGTFVDFESGLNTATNRLRAALGDSAEAPRYIETLPRLGYRFICPVVEIDENERAAISPDVGPPLETNGLKPPSAGLPSLHSQIPGKPQSPP